MRVEIVKSGKKFVMRARSDDRRDKKSYHSVEMGDIIPLLEQKEFKAMVATVLRIGAENYVKSVGAHRYTSLKEN